MLDVLLVESSKAMVQVYKKMIPVGDVWIYNRFGM